MKSNINLFVQHKTVNRRLRQRLQALRFSAVSLLFIVGGCSMVLFFLIAASPLPSLQKEENAAKFDIEQLHPKMAKYFIITDQLKHITTVMKGRVSYNDIMNTLQRGLPSSMRITDLQMDEKNISITFASNSLEDFNDFLAQADTLTDTNGIFQQMLIEGLTVNPQNGQYTLVVSLTR